ncbi:MAG TPA: hypothetical protein VGI04_03135 [Neobacillus sp.]
MVIQSNMSSKEIVEVWKNTADIFHKYKIPITEEMLEDVAPAEIISILLRELNNFVGSSTVTCIAGG